VIDLSRACFLAAALPMLVLGVAHALATPLRPTDKKGLSLRDPALSAQMVGARLYISPDIDLWAAWVSFNFTHSLAAGLLGLFTLAAGYSEATFALNAPVFLPVCLAASATFLGLGLRYWFRIPIAGVTLSLLLYASSAVLWWL
jgi:hypothetical protein